MTRATLSEVLTPALRDGYAVAGLVVLGWEDARAYVTAAEAEGLPVILQAGPGCRAHTPLPILGAMFRTLAEGAKVPVVAHLDHGKTLDECRAAIDAGFTSIMFDGSALPLADNIRATTAAVRLAKDNGLSCEGELGFVGYAEGTPGVGTIPSEAALFEAETGIDALAVSVGNVHLQREQAAVIDHDRLAEIGAVTRCPLVIHGGSGLTNADRALLAHRSPVCKFNIGTELRQVFGKALRQRLSDDPALFDRIAILSAVEGPLVAATKEILRGIGPIGPK